MTDQKLPHDKDLPPLSFPSLSNFNNNVLLVDNSKLFSFNSLNFDSKQPLLDHALQEPNSIEIEAQKHAEKKLKRKKKVGCICKKIDCLKMYCECFANGRLCGQKCECQNCCNVEQNIHQIKKIRKAIKEKKRRNRGCTCKKSKCEKKYCECFRANLPCTSECQCIDCNNLEEREQKRANFLAMNSLKSFSSFNRIQVCPIDNKQ